MEIEYLVGILVHKYCTVLFIYEEVPLLNGKI
jgi:hypothetical protein